jgi:hypothetical protein
LPSHSATKRVVGNVAGRCQRGGEQAFKVIADRFDAGGHGLLQQITVGQFVQRESVDRDHDQAADDQRCTHAQGQLPLNTFSPDRHRKLRRYERTTTMEQCG